MATELGGWLNAQPRVEPARAGNRFWQLKYRHGLKGCQEALGDGEDVVPEDEGELVGTSRMTKVEEMEDRWWEDGDDIADWDS